jgi:U3 small nucleolar RNA-associated protein 14
VNNSKGSDNEVEEEGEPDEFFDVLDILDGRADPLSDDEPSAPPPRQDEIPHASSDEEEADDDDDHDMDVEEAGQLAPSDDEADVDALDNLGQFISNLDPSTKRKNSEDEGVIEAEGNAPRKKRKLHKERNEAGTENEFAASGEPECDLSGIPHHSNTWVP